MSAVERSCLLSFEETLGIISSIFNIAELCLLDGNKSRGVKKPLEQPRS